MSGGDSITVKNGHKLSAENATDDILGISTEKYGEVSLNRIESKNCIMNEEHSSNEFGRTGSPIAEDLNLDVRIEEACQSISTMLVSEAAELEISDRIEAIMTCISYAQKKCERLSGSDLVLVIGNTGVGKSTFLNYLSGCTMIETFPQDLDFEGVEPVIRVQPPEEGGLYPELFAIGHRKTSETSLPRIRRAYEEDIVFCDCPGFVDNRGPDISIINAVAMKNIIQQAKTVKVILLINYLSIKVDRGRGIVDTVNLWIQLFGSELKIKQNKDSIMIGITQAPPNANLKAAKKYITGNFFEHEIGRSVQMFFYDPLDRGNADFWTRKNCLDALFKLKPIENPGHIFATAFTTEDELLLIKITRYLEAKMNYCMDTYDYAGTQEHWSRMKNFLSLLSNNAANNLLNEIQKNLEQAAQQRVDEFIKYLLMENLVSAKNVLGDLYSMSDIFSAEVRCVNMQKLNAIFSDAEDRHAARKDYESEMKESFKSIEKDSKNLRTSLDEQMKAMQKLQEDHLKEVFNERKLLEDREKASRAEREDLIRSIDKLQENHKKELIIERQFFEEREILLRAEKEELTKSIQILQEDHKEEIRTERERFENREREYDAEKMQLLQSLQKLEEGHKEQLRLEHERMKKCQEDYTAEQEEMMKSIKKLQENHKEEIRIEREFFEEREETIKTEKKELMQTIIKLQEDHKEEIRIEREFFEEREAAAAAEKEELIKSVQRLQEAHQKEIRIERQFFEGREATFNAEKEKEIQSMLQRIQDDHNEQIRIEQERLQQSEAKHEADREELLQSIQQLQQNHSEEIRKEYERFKSRERELNAEKEELIALMKQLQENLKEEMRIEHELLLEGGAATDAEKEELMKSIQKQQENHQEQIRVEREHFEEREVAAKADMEALLISMQQLQENHKEQIRIEREHFEEREEAARIEKEALVQSMQKLLEDHKEDIRLEREFFEECTAAIIAEKEELLLSIQKLEKDRKEMIIMSEYCDEHETSLYADREELIKSIRQLQPNLNEETDIEYGTLKASRWSVYAEREELMKSIRQLQSDSIDETSVESEQPVACVFVGDAERVAPISTLTLTHDNKKETANENDPLEENDIASDTERENPFKPTGTLQENSNEEMSVDSNRLDECDTLLDTEKAERIPLTPLEKNPKKETGTERDVFEEFGRATKAEWEAANKACAEYAEKLSDLLNGIKIIDREDKEAKEGESVERNLIEKQLEQLKQERRECIIS